MCNLLKNFGKMFLFSLMFCMMMFFVTQNYAYSQTLEGTGIVINTTESGHENEDYYIFPLWGGLQLSAFENGEGKRNLLRLHWTTGICNFYGTVIAQGYSCSSDGRFKHNITPVSHALQKIMGLQGVAYDWNSEKFKDRSFSKDRQIGFIAQDVEKVIPELVTTDNDGYKSLDYSKLSVILVEAMKEMNLRTVSLEKENAVLKKRLASLEKISERVAKLENMIKSNTSLASR